MKEIVVSYVAPRLEILEAPDETEISIDLINRIQDGNLVTVDAPLITFHGVKGDVVYRIIRIGDEARTFIVEKR